MFRIPRIQVEEHWGGDVDIVYEDHLPYELQKDIADQLEISVQKMQRDKRCAHALQRAVEGYLQILVSNHKLRFSPITKTWIYSKR